MSEIIEYNRSHWYAARVKYRAEKKLKSFLEKERNDIGFFIPFKTVISERAGERFPQEKPIIPCLVFVNTDYRTALLLPELSGLSVSYIKNLSTNHIRVIPDKQMQDFMRVLDLSEKGSILLSENLKRGDKVRVIKGVFAGVEGELVRIKGHKRVVVNLEGVCSLATTYIPLEYLELIN
ncbi:MAG: UpxY family transcription antiterminator [Dysgonamonadaceae bacterium]|nr:UpxY family transcription antiterminator [Dysgonamonadaceae bacterium]